MTSSPFPDKWEREGFNPPAHSTHPVIWHRYPIPLAAKKRVDFGLFGSYAEWYREFKGLEAGGKSAGELFVHFYLILDRQCIRLQALGSFFARELDDRSTDAFREKKVDVVIATVEDLWDAIYKPTLNDCRDIEDALVEVMTRGP